MTQHELAFWRDAVLAALSAPETVDDGGERRTAVARADEALEAYRKHKAAAEAYHRSLGAPKASAEKAFPPVFGPNEKP